MSVELSFAPEQQALRAARQAAREAALRLGATERIGDTVALAVDELGNNAIEHGAVYRRADLPLLVRLAALPHGIALEFLDREMPAQAVHELHDALAQASRGEPSLDSERGRGLFLLSVYVEALQVEVGAEGGMCLRGVIAEGAD